MLAVKKKQILLFASEADWKHLHQSQDLIPHLHLREKYLFAICLQSVGKQLLR